MKISGKRVISGMKITRTKTTKHCIIALAFTAMCLCVLINHEALQRYGLLPTHSAEPHQFISVTEDGIWKDLLTLNLPETEKPLCPLVSPELGKPVIMYYDYIFHVHVVQLYMFQ